MLQNTGATDRSYELSVSGLSWGTYRFDPGALVLLRSGETKTVYLYVAANDDAPEGEQVFKVTVETSGDEKEIALTANVVAGESSGLGGFGDVRKALEVKKIETATAEITMIPSSTVKVEGNDAKHILDLMETLEDHEDIQRVYANFDISDEEMAKVTADHID